jgi:hypothetical protein
MSTTDPSDTVKRCARCGEEKPHSAFNRNLTRPGGLQSWCRECQREPGRAWAAARLAANREAVYERKRAQRAANLERYQARERQWRVANRERRLELLRGLRGEALLIYGDGSCAECGYRPDDVTELELDHVNGDGAEHRRQLGLGRSAGRQFVIRLRARGWPNDPPLQTLCHDCHVAKTARERAARVSQGARRT